MKNLSIWMSAALVASVAALALPASAQMNLYENYQPAEEVTELTFVKVDEGQFETYLEGLKSTWIAANEAQKQLGYVSSYGIYGVPYGENEFNMVLQVTFPNTDMIGPSKERYMAFLDAYGKANIDTSNTTVLEVYNNIRTIQGTYLLRKVEMIGE